MLMFYNTIKQSAVPLAYIPDFVACFAEVPKVQELQYFIMRPGIAKQIHSVTRCKMELHLEEKKEITTRSILNNLHGVHN